jgi:hypothetical protein
MNCLTTKNFTMRKFYLMAVMTAAFFSLSAQRTATFEDVELPDSSFYNGSDGAGGFTSGDFWFPLDYNSTWDSWSGFSLSNMMDTVTPGYQNQYSSIAGGGAGGSEKYVTVYDSGELNLILQEDMKINGFFITNTTYAYLAMKEGSDWTKKFGGSDGTEPDYFKLMVWGRTPAGHFTDTIEYFLADFRFEDPNEDFIVKEWEWLDLASLGLVNVLNFSLESSDVGEYGMNTPAYFCLDDFTGAVPSFSSPVEKTQTELKVYPNPIRDELYIDVPQDTEQVVITNMSGKIFFRSDNPEPGTHRIGEVNRLPSGILIVYLNKGQDRLYKKVVKL